MNECNLIMTFINRTIAITLLEKISKTKNNKLIWYYKIIKKKMNPCSFSYYIILTNKIEINGKTKCKWRRTEVESVRFCFCFFNSLVQQLGIVSISKLDKPYEY